MVGLLATTAPGAMFAIGTPTTANLPAVQPDTAQWPVPSIALLRDTVLGAAPFAPFYETPPDQLRGAPWDSLRMSDQFDALLYLGAPETITLAPLLRRDVRTPGHRHAVWHACRWCPGAIPDRAAEERMPVRHSGE